MVSEQLKEATTLIVSECMIEATSPTTLAVAGKLVQRLLAAKSVPDDFLMYIVFWCGCTVTMILASGVTLHLQSLNVGDKDTGQHSYIFSWCVAGPIYSLTTGRATVACRRLSMQ